MESKEPELLARAPTGVPGLDEILNGGYPRHHLYLVQGEAGTGKTTLGIQFLLEGIRAGETSMIVTLAEAADDLRQMAHSHGWSLDGIEIYELTEETAQQLEHEQTIFPTAEVELSQVSDEIVAELQRVQPDRVVFDSVTELRLLAQGPLRYRRQMLALRTTLHRLGATALFTDIQAVPYENRVMDSLVHGIIRLERQAPNYGTTRRRLQVSKMRGMRYAEGWHDLRLDTGGISVFPRPGAEFADKEESWKQISSGIEELDKLLGGGLELGTAALLVGASGTGKSSVANLYLYNALEQGRSGALLVFDERPATLFKRADDLGAPLKPFAQAGTLTIRAVETGEISPGEFAAYVRWLVEVKNIEVLVVDSLTGYTRAMPGEKLLMNQMHDLLNYLSHEGVLTILIVTRHAMLDERGGDMLDMSYLSDTVVLLRHFEADGRLHQALSVIKKRHGEHEKSIRELLIRPGSVTVSEPLSDFRGIMTGNPEFHGRMNTLLSGDEQGE